MDGSDKVSAAAADHNRLSNGQFRREQCVSSSDHCTVRGDGYRAGDRSAVPAVAGSSIKSGRIDIGVRKHL